MPSRFEPCGLAQMQSMRYGTLPLVTDVGGLHDTVIDVDAAPTRGTGVVVPSADLGGVDGRPAPHGQGLLAAAAPGGDATARHGHRLVVEASGSGTHRLVSNACSSEPRIGKRLTCRSMAEPKVLVVVLAGGEGKRLAPLTADRAKPAVPFGGTYRIIDFVLSNFANARLSEDRRADPVQEPQPRPPHQPDVAVLHAARQLRHARARPDAARTAVVQRIGRRDLPEPQPHQRRASRHRLRVRRRSHLPHGSPPDGRASHGASAPASRSRPSLCRCHEAIAVRHHRGRRTDGKIIGFHEKPADPPTMPGDTSRVLASMGNYVFDTQTLIDVVSPTGTDDDRHRHRRRCHPDADPRRRRPHVRLLDQHHPRPDRARARLLARCRKPRCVLRGQHGSHRPRAAVQPLQRRVAGLQPAAAAAARQDRPRPGWRAADHRQQPAVRRVDRLGWNRRALDPRARDLRRCVSGGQRVDPVPRRARRARCATAPMRHRQERRDSRRAARSATTPRPTERSSSSAIAASSWSRRTARSTDRVDAVAPAGTCRRATQR